MFFLEEPNVYARKNKTQLAVTFSLEQGRELGRTTCSSEKMVLLSLKPTLSMEYKYSMYHSLLPFFTIFTRLQRIKFQDNTFWIKSPLVVSCSPHRYTAFHWDKEKQKNEEIGELTWRKWSQIKVLTPPVRKTAPT